MNPELMRNEMLKEMVKQIKAMRVELAEMKERQERLITLMAKSPKSMGGKK